MGGAVLDRHWGWSHVMGLGAAVTVPVTHPTGSHLRRAGGGPHRGLAACSAIRERPHGCSGAASPLGLVTRHGDGREGVQWYDSSYGSHLRRAGGGLYRGLAPGSAIGDGRHGQHDAGSPSGSATRCGRAPRPAHQNVTLLRTSPPPSLPRGVRGGRYRGLAPGSVVRNGTYGSYGAASPRGWAMR